ncbi:MAG TPA: SRPBCC family protein [Dermatophilaceae bacterium]|nr:SRPBCC family protein [Dermatophilaceae bacterium]
MITVNRHTGASPADVWTVIADGWSYASWVVGASRIRAVSADWPLEGARIHHSVGAWPAVLDDETVVLHCEPGRLIRLRAKTNPIGEAFVELELTPEDGGTRIEMREDAESGPMTLVPQAARQLMIAPRNREATLRLALIAERRTSPPT